MLSMKRINFAKNNVSDIALMEKLCYHYLSTNPHYIHRKTLSEYKTRFCKKTKKYRKIIQHERFDINGIILPIES